MNRLIRDTARASPYLFRVPFKRPLWTIEKKGSILKNLL